MIGTKTYDEWVALSADSVRTVRAMADWTADIATTIRVLARDPELAALADTEPGTAFYHVEQANFWLVERATGGLASSAITPRMLEWLTEPSDRDATLRKLADELGRLLVILNVVSAGPGLWKLATSAQGHPYWHIGRAHIAVLTILAGNDQDGWRLHELWSDNQECTSWNMRQLAERKRAESVIVTVAPDGDTATITGPGGETGHAGRVQHAGPFWVADETDAVIGHEPAWMGAGALLAAHYGYPADTPVIVDYAEPDTQAGTQAGTADSAHGGAGGHTDTSATTGPITGSTEVPNA